MQGKFAPTCRMCSIDFVGEPSSSRRFGGLGLGLSIVKSLRWAAWRVGAGESPGEQQGSTFIVALPVATFRIDRAGIHSEISSRIHRLSGTPQTSMVFRSDRRRRTGLDARSSHAFWKAAGLGRRVCPRQPKRSMYWSRKDRHPLSDIGMPGMDGFELIRRVRQMDGERSRQLPAVAITAYARTEDAPAIFARRLSYASVQTYRSARANRKCFAGLLRLSRREPAPVTIAPSQ